MRFHYFNARFRVQNSDLEKHLVNMVIRILQTVFFGRNRDFANHVYRLLRGGVWNLELLDQTSFPRSPLIKQRHFVFQELLDFTSSGSNTTNNKALGIWMQRKKSCHTALLFFVTAFYFYCGES